MAFRKLGHPSHLQGLRAEVNSLVYLPTNRECVDAIRSYATEIKWANLNNHSTLLCVIESNDEPDANINHEALLSVSEERVPVLHLDIALQRYLLPLVCRNASLSASETALVERCLMPSESCYSSNPNKASILAEFLGAKTLHRRDSDTLIRQTSPDFFPISKEIAAIGRPLGETCEDYQEKLANEPAAAVGTGYLGDESLDRRLFKRHVPHLLQEHERIISPGLDASELQKKVEYKYYWQARQDPRTLDLPRICHDRSGFSEMGCIAFDVQLGLVPELPLPGCLSTEHFHKNLLHRMDLPIVYHKTLVSHTSVARANLETDVEVYSNYAEKDAAFKAMRVPLRALNEEIKTSLNSVSKEASLRQFLSNCYAGCISKSIARASMSEMKDIVETTAHLYAQASRATDSNSNSSQAFKAASKLLHARSHLICEHVLQGFERYASLSKIWMRILSGANSIRPTHD